MAERSVSVIHYDKSLNRIAFSIGDAWMDCSGMTLKGHLEVLAGQAANMIENNLVKGATSISISRLAEALA